ncbi:MAG: membrane protein insertion efficiency factor YidD [Pseudomonadales bacterium]|nr:membrane protein insertion efficiency factor YidD [Pseudomonadales bacterium]
MTDSCQVNNNKPALPAAKLGLAARFGVGCIRLYQITLSPWLGNQCRFYPTCSHYGIHAISTHGLAKGLWLTVKRLSKCQPFHPGGIDEVPQANGKPSRPSSAK